MMDCKKTNRDELIDSYLRNELPAKEADLFEEHLLVCTVCRNELTEREEIINSIQKYAANKTLETLHTVEQREAVEQREELTKKRSKILWYVVAAASIALVISLFFLTDRNTPSSLPQLTLR